MTAEEQENSRGTVRQHLYVYMCVYICGLRGMNRRRVALGHEDPRRYPSAHPFFVGRSLIAARYHDLTAEGQSILALSSEVGDLLEIFCLKGLGWSVCLDTLSLPEMTTGSTSTLYG